MRLTTDGVGFVIDRVVLTLEASVPGIDDAAFNGIADDTKRNCPSSKALASVPEISLTARLKK